MRNNYFLKFSAPLFVLLLFCASACRVADEGAYTNWDADSDARLDANEFGAAWGESGYFDRWDANRDGFVDESEWNAGRNTFMTEYNEAEFGTFDDWDVDDDNRLADNEFQEGVFDVYDADNDNFWTDTEYGTWWGTFNAGL